MSLKSSAFRLCAAVIVSAFLVPAAFGQSELQFQMDKLGSDFASGKSDQATTENAFLSLESEFPQDAGKIYSQLAMTFASKTRHPDPDKVIQYAELALQQSLDPSDAVETNVLLAEGLHMKYRTTTGQEWADRRQDIASAYLRGLKIAIDNLTQDNKRPLPAVPRGTCAGTKEECAGFQSKHEAAIAEQQRAEKQNRLIDQRDAIIRNLSTEFSSFPKNAASPDLAAFEKLSRETLTMTHDDLTNRIIDSIKTNRTTRGRVEKGGVKKVIQGERLQAVPKQQ